MKKLLMLLCTLAVAFSLATPVFTKGHGKKQKETAATAEHGKAHMKHAKKKGATKGLKKGQQGTTPGEAQKQ